MLFLTLLSSSACVLGLFPRLTALVCSSWAVLPLADTAHVNVTGDTRHNASSRACAAWKRLDQDERQGEDEADARDDQHPQRGVEASLARGGREYCAEQLVWRQ